LVSYREGEINILEDYSPQSSRAKAGSWKAALCRSGV
jgi:hypothetical protein